MMYCQDKGREGTVSLGKLVSMNHTTTEDTQFTYRIKCLLLYIGAAARKKSMQWFTVQ